MNKSTAILLAGGKGTRFDPDNLKTLHMVGDITLTELVINNIKSSNLFDDVILVYNIENKKEFSKIISDTNVTGVKNGQTRFLSALNGLKLSKTEKNVFIDVAAPFYENKMLKEMIKKLDNYNGIMTTILDTRADHVLVKDGVVAEIFKRGEILRVKSYQAVNKSVWMHSFNNINSEKRENYTEMLKLLMDNNEKIGNVISENNPRKLTTKDDLRIFKK